MKCLIVYLFLDTFSNNDDYKFGEYGGSHDVVEDMEDSEQVKCYYFS